MRRAGNAANHALSGDHRTALAALKITWQLGIWFQRTFRDANFKSGPFIPPQAPTVRGLASILANGLNGSAPEEILNIPADFYLQMNLQDVISHQRLNGFMGILAHMKQIAARNLG